MNLLSIVYHYLTENSFIARDYTINRGYFHVEFANCLVGVTVTLNNEISLHLTSGDSAHVIATFDSRDPQSLPNLITLLKRVKKLKTIIGSGLVPLHYNIVNMTVRSNLHRFMIVSTCRGICAVIPSDGIEDFLKKIPHAVECGQQHEAENHLSHVLEGHPYIIELQKRNFTPGAVYIRTDTLDGGVFQRSVWKAVCQIRRGTTVSYSMLAETLELPGSAQAIAQACGANLLSILVPCHRVVSMTGIGGYRWGVELKRELLRSEGVVM